MGFHVERRDDLVSIKEKRAYFLFALEAERNGTTLGLTRRGV